MFRKQRTTDDILSDLHQKIDELHARQKQIDDGIAGDKQLIAFHEQHIATLNASIEKGAAELKHNQAVVRNISDLLDASEKPALKAAAE